ncbi:MAG: type II toxin-antitoxin system PemK/MazF family toxin [Deltaproteobacteria bacterium]|nr:type II toxin-antitoxin system PemK/MazF family toxin [Deltaproteobacteria bacterium]
MRRGEVWLINLDPTIGAELKKIRPAVIINDDALGMLPLKVIVPLTAWKQHYRQAPWLVYIAPTEANGLDNPSAADTFQVRSLSQERLVRCLGRLTESDLKNISSALALVLSIEL